MNVYSDLISKLNTAKKVLVVSHYNPDGDAIGSTIAMFRILKESGKEVSMYNRDGVPDNLKFLVDSEKVSSKLNATEKFDLTVMVDCAQRKRISDDFAALTGTGLVACIDHHLFETPESDVDLIDKKAASTGEVVYRLAGQMKAKIDAGIAECIYTTLVVDTGFFKYSTTNAEILGLASELVKLGANPWTVAKNLEESYPASRMKLLGASLASMKLEFGGRYATMDVTQEMLKKTGATMDMSDEFATFPRSINGVEVSALFRELGDGKVKASLRSKDVVDVAAVAKNFGGGGHARAAGCQIKAGMEEARSKMLGLIAESLR